MSQLLTVFLKQSGLQKESDWLYSGDLCGNGYVLYPWQYWSLARDVPYKISYLKGQSVGGKQVWRPHEILSTFINPKLTQPKLWLPTELRALSIDFDGLGGSGESSAGPFYFNGGLRSGKPTARWTRFWAKGGKVCFSTDASQTIS